LPLGEQVGIGVIAGIARDGGDGEGEKVVAADEVKVEVDQWRELLRELRGKMVMVKWRKLLQQMK